jgi:hypothetical protein
MLVGTGVAGGYANQGYSVSLSADGNTAIIGGVSDSSGVGAAWMFRRDGGMWSQYGQKLVGTGGDTHLEGTSVALSSDGTTAIVSGEGTAWVFIRIATADGEQPLEVPRQFGLDQNYPNPFNPSTTIRYGVPERSHVSLAVYNQLGQQVAVLQNGEQEARYHDVKFDASNLPSGVYFYRLQAGSYVETRKLCLVR